MIIGLHNAVSRDAHWCPAFAVSPSVDEELASHGKSIKHCHRRSGTGSNPFIGTFVICAGGDVGTDMPEHCIVYYPHLVS